MAAGHRATGIGHATDQTARRRGRHFVAGAVGHAGCVDHRSVTQRAIGHQRATDEDLPLATGRGACSGNIAADVVGAGLGRHAVDVDARDISTGDRPGRIRHGAAVTGGRESAHDVARTVGNISRVVGNGAIGHGVARHHRAIDLDLVGSGVPGGGQPGDRALEVVAGLLRAADVDTRDIRPINRA